MREIVTTAIPRWLAALDETKPYVEVLDGERLAPVSPYFVHGELAVELAVQVRRWANGRGAVGAEVRFYFHRVDATWSSLLPDVSYMSFERLPRSLDDEFQRPRIAPDIAIEILSPDDRPSRVKRKVDTYLEYGATLILVLDPRMRRVALHRSDGTVEERDARGSWRVTPFDGLVVDWDEAYREIGIT
jgi:Uma2 family endonuclease